MSFSYPQGFLVLLFIPVLIIIYILKNKFTEQVVSSTYLWTLSQKFLKRKKSLSRIYGILSLILQIFAVTAIAFMIARPNIKLPNQARNLNFILDGSGSMNMTNGNSTRFDLAKEEIKTQIDSCKEGSTYSLIYVTDSARVIFERLTDKNRAISLLDTLSPISANANCLDAIPYAQMYFDDNKSTETFLVTDKKYDLTNIKLINVGQIDIENFSLVDVNYSVSARYLKISGTVLSHLNEGNVKVSIYVDENEQELASKEIEVNTFSFTYNAQIGNFDFTDLYIGDNYSSIKVKIEALNTNDSLLSDNEMIFYNIMKEHGNKTLLVSDNPIYLENILSSLGTLDLTVIKSKEYSEAYSIGYGLYIFDSYNPNILPTDGTVWTINIGGVEGQTGMKNYGFSYQTTIDYGTQGIELDVTGQTNSLVTSLKEGLINEQFYITKYKKYGLYNNYTVLYRCNGDPVIFVGNTTNGNRQIVFGFDLQDSNIALNINFVILFRNLINFSFPTILENASYFCGDDLLINIIDGVKSVRIVDPDGISQYYDTSNPIIEHRLLKSGTYEIYVGFEGYETKFEIYAYPDLGESQIIATQIDSISLVGEQEHNYGDAIYESIVYLFIILGAIFIADWLVYCYEQYKLR
ncbi:MAG: BatA domain-containing protein [Anaeroplasma sp.]